MGKDVDQLAEGVARIEAPHAPGFVGRSVFDGEAGRLHPLEHGVDIVDLALYLPRHFRNRSQMAVLVAMNDHELRDIGLTRLDVVMVSAVPPSRDPTEALASIVQERRRWTRGR